MSAQHNQRNRAATHLLFGGTVRFSGAPCDFRRVCSKFTGSSLQSAEADFFSLYFMFLIASSVFDCLFSYCLFLGFFVLNLLKFSSHLLNFFAYFFAYSLLAYFGFFCLFSLIFAYLLKVLFFLTTEKSLRIGGLFGLWLVSHNPSPPISETHAKNAKNVKITSRTLPGRSQPLRSET